MDAEALNNILELIVPEKGDNFLKRLGKAGLWAKRKKRVLEICQSLEKKKTTLILSGVYQKSATREAGHELAAIVNERFV